MPDTLADFPQDRFEILAFCACGHSQRVPREQLDRGVPIDSLVARLRCQTCGGSDVGIRIVWTATVSGLATQPLSYPDG